MRRKLTDGGDIAAAGLDPWEATEPITLEEVEARLRGGRAENGYFETPSEKGDQKEVLTEARTQLESYTALAAVATGPDLAGVLVALRRDEALSAALRAVPVEAWRDEWTLLRPHFRGHTKEIDAWYAGIAAQKDEDARRRAEETRAEGRPVMGHKNGPKIYYVRADTPEGEDWIPADLDLVPHFIAKWHPDIPLEEDGAEIHASALVRRYCEPIARIEYHNTLQTSRWVEASREGATLQIACCRRLEITPAYSADCAAYLDRLGGAAADKLLDWLATAPDLTWPTAALLLQGPPGAGKGLLAAALAGLWGSAPASYEDVLGTQFNSALRDNPVVFLDERAPRLSAQSGPFRSLVGETQRTLTEKYRPTANLYGAVRLIVATNSDDPLGLGAEVLSPHDEEAIGIRVLHVEIPDTARGHLQRRHTAEWVRTRGGQPGELVRHLAWLETHRTVERGDRFLVEGNAKDWIRRVGRGDPVSQGILVAVARVASADDFDAAEGTAVWIRSGEAWVSAGQLPRHWTRLTGRDRAPTPEALGRALRRLTGGEKPIKPRATGQRPVWPVPAEAVLEIAERWGVGAPDRIAERLGLAVDRQQGGQVAAPTASK